MTHFARELLQPSETEHTARVAKKGKCTEAQIMLVPVNRQLLSNVEIYSSAELH